MERDEQMPKVKLPPSRRRFLERIGGGALAAAASTTVPISGYSAQASGTEWSSTYDWICVGSGIAGCSAAIAGSDRGFKTLLIEKQSRIGGLTSDSGGSVWVPMNFLQKAEGIKDTREEALEYLQYSSAGYAHREHMETYVDNAARVVEYLRQKAEVNFRKTGNDGYPVVPAPKTKKGRIIACEPFPTETLGAWRDKVRLPVRPRGFYAALEGFNPPLNGKSPVRTVETRMAVWRKKLGDKKFEELLKKDKEIRTGGAGLVAYLFRAVIKRGIDVWTEASGERLLEQNGHVVGLVVNRSGKEVNIRATKGIVLATGSDPLEVEAGPAWRLATGVGAAVETEGVVVGHHMIHAPGEDYPDGTPAGYENEEVARPHSLFVNRFGERFGDESFFEDLGSRINNFDAAGQHRFRNIPCYIIFDHNLIDKTGFAGMPPGTLEGLEWVTKAATLAELAQKFNLPAAKLQATVARFNENAQRRKDLDFNRTPESLAPLEKPPFYGVEIDIKGKYSFMPDPFRAAIRVVTDHYAQVLHYKSQKPIPGLYACGAVATSSRIWGVGYQVGYGLMAFATFGFLAAERAAAIAGDRKNA